MDTNENDGYSDSWETYMDERGAVFFCPKKTQVSEPESQEDQSTEEKLPDE